MPFSTSGKGLAPVFLILLITKPPPRHFEYRMDTTLRGDPGSDWIEESRTYWRNIYMKRNIFWIFLVTAPLVSASTLGSFEATCSGTVCSGSYDGNTFVFTGPFPDGRVPAEPPSYNPYIEFSIGTHGGGFGYGDHTCDYDVQRSGGI